jgi:enolase
MLRPRRLSAIEILDSRARPTLAVTLELEDGVVVRSGVPSGASTGSREAKELRDGDPARFAGQGVRRAVANVNGEIAEAVCSRSFADITDLDEALIAIDGTPDKARLGANAVVGVTMAAARAAAVESGVPLWQTLSLPGATPRTPVPHFNVVNGGLHALNDLDFQTRSSRIWPPEPVVAK